MAAQEGLIDIRSIRLFTQNSIEDLPEISVEAREIDLVKKIITRDRGSKGDHDGRKKDKARKELAFVFFFLNNDYFAQYSEEQRVKKIKENLDLPTKWQPDLVVLDLIELFKEVGQSPVERGFVMLNNATTTAIDALKIITKFIENKKNTIEDMQPDSTSFLNEAENTSMNVLLHEVVQQIKIVLDYSNSLPKSLEHLEEYRKKLKEERKSKIRGNKIVNPFVE